MQRYEMRGRGAGRLRPAAALRKERPNRAECQGLRSKVHGRVEVADLSHSAGGGSDGMRKTGKWKQGG